MPHILFAHSDQKTSRVYGGYLTKHFSLDSAFDGLTALRKFKQSQPNLIVSAYDLPILSGTGLLKFVRTKSNYPAIPFLFFAGSGDPALALSLGANDWLDLRKTTPDLLIEKIYYHLSRTTFSEELYKR